MRVSRTLAIAGSLAVAVLVVPPAVASSAGCGRAVIFTLPGVTWEEIGRERPPGILELMSQGASGSVSVRTNSSRTSYASGFATLGAGTRVEGGVTTGGQIESGRDGPWSENVEVAGVAELRRIADSDGYGAVPGALGEALGDIPTIAIGNAELTVPPSPVLGYERWTLLAAMDAQGIVDRAATGSDLIDAGSSVRTDPLAFSDGLETALAEPCALVVIDQGDLIRSELTSAAPVSERVDRKRALAAADQGLSLVADLLDTDDLLIAISPTSPAADEVHLGVAIVRGPGYDPGRLLSSASTRRAGTVTLPDVAPSVLAFMGIERHPAMLGRPFFTVASEGDRVAMAIEDDREAVFVDRVRSPVTTVFVVAQVAVYVLIAWILYRRQRGGAPPAGSRWLETGALAIVAFPACTYLMGALPQHRLGTWGLAAALVGLDAALLGVVHLIVSRPLDRLLVLTGGTVALLVADVVTGASLQVNTVFSYSPLVAGRFAGFGNTAFSVLGAAAIVTGSLLVQRSGGSRAASMSVAGLFVAVVIADGAPAWGSDVGGVLAFVPSFGICWLLLAGRKPTWRLVGVCAGAAVAVLGIFLAFDLSRPIDERTHLARLYEDVTSRGGSAFLDTIGRKVSTNLRVFTSTIWTYFVPPALAFIAWLLLRPRNRWERLAREYPTLRAGLIGGLVLCVLGFAVNDSGIVVPAMVLSYLVPVALLAHLLLERDEAGHG